MKNYLFLFLYLLGFDVISQNVNIPDLNFKNALLSNSSINLNSDGEIDQTEASTYQGSLFLGNLNISDLTGIEAFTSIYYLDVSNNNLSSLDLQSNLNLATLNCSFNHLNQLNINGLFALGNLECNNNMLTNLNTGSNTNLVYVNCSNNYITGLCLVNSSFLNNLDCSNNSLLNLNVKNGNNLNFNSFFASGNANLTCITVDDEIYSGQNWVNVDPFVSFSSQCIGTYVYFPDPNFKQVILGNLGINPAQNQEITYSDASNYTSTINAMNQGIYDLTGLEAFPNIIGLFVDSNNLPRLNVTANPNLTILTASHNNLQTIELGNQPQLYRLFCQNNFITNLDLSNVPALQYFYAMNNSFSGLNLTDNPGLIALSVSGNFYTLDLSQNTQLDSLVLYTYSLPSLDLSQNTILRYLYMPYCQTYSLDFSNNPFLHRVQIEYNQLSTLDLSNQPYLTELICTGNQLSSINLTNTPQLQQLICNSNLLTNLDLSLNPSLTRLICMQNDLSSLNIKNGNTNSITQFDASQNPNLSCIQVDDPAFSYAVWANNIDPGTSFSQNCIAACNQYISGFITDGGLGNYPTLGPNDTLVVKLLSIQNQDSLAWDTISILEITQPNDSAFFSFGPIPEGDYVIQASYTSEVAGENYISTFSGNSYLYQEADTISVSTCDSLSYSINLINPATINGDGALSGFIYFYNFLLGKTENNDPIPLIDVVVEKDSTPTNQLVPVRYVQAHLVSGFTNLYFYESDSLPFGDYEIQVVVAGIPQIGFYSPVLTVANDSIPHLNFCVDPYSLGVVDICDFDTVPDLMVGQPESPTQDLHFSPNPTDGNFIIHWLGANQTCQIEILDLNGKLVFQELVESNELKVGKNIKSMWLRAGIYMLRISNVSQTFTQKMVILED